VLFSPRQAVEPEVLSPNRIVARAERLLRRTLGEDVDLRIELADEVPPVEIDPGQPDRVLLNLAVNARDAMPEGGRLAIATGRSEVPGRPHARIAISDTGVVMEPEAVERAFEPLFTTKESSGGTGLGSRRCTES
jgi:signal transduction histidine kinase